MNAVHKVRNLADPQSRPALPRHVRLHFDPVRQAWALLSPEKIFWPDETSLAILQLCNGSGTIGEISARLAAEYDADPAVIAEDVIAFVQDWSDRMVLKL